MSLLPCQRPTLAPTMLRPACLSTTIDPIAAKRTFRQTLEERQQRALEGGGLARLDAQVCCMMVCISALKCPLSLFSLQLSVWFLVNLVT